MAYHRMNVSQYTQGVLDNSVFCLFNYRELIGLAD